MKQKRKQLEQQYFKTKDLSEIYNVDEETIRRWVKSGKVQVKIIGNRFYFPKEDHDSTLNQ